MAKIWTSARSICTCKHTGDGERSQHTDTGFAAGHGLCCVRGCGCNQFTWKSWLPDFWAYHRREKGESDGENSP